MDGRPGGRRGLTAASPSRAARRAFAGYRATAFTNEEEIQGGPAGQAERLLRDRLTEAGVAVRASGPWTPHAVVDRNLITGRNPASSAPAAKEPVKLLG
ncbi:hypothetical protein [Streptomyces nogalater]|uniref:Uncharacterized protein n=1 Tax=Streptomyces nogalater TaxID=38314 RepID=A0ABW0WPN5_STRNO